jgi:hypothetical protein
VLYGTYHNYTTYHEALTCIIFYDLFCFLALDSLHDELDGVIAQSGHDQPKRMRKSQKTIMISESGVYVWLYAAYSFQILLKIIAYQTVNKFSPVFYESIKDFGNGNQKKKVVAIKLIWSRIHHFLK